MSDVRDDLPPVIRIDLGRDEAMALVRVVDALNEKVKGVAPLSSALGLNGRTLELADAAGAKILLRL
jgi:hypothetical protein